MNDTNITTTGSGTASDPTTFNNHVTSQSVVISHFGLYVVIIVVGLAAVTGFGLGFYFGKSRKNPN
jgi:hypothetical protein